MPGRPLTQPQIEVAAHSVGQQCNVCHNPHSPKIAAAAVKVTGDMPQPASGAQPPAPAATAPMGISPNDTWPSLAGQNAAYLVRILAAYQSGDQTDAAMTPLAKVLSNADIQNLAALLRQPELQRRRPAESLSVMPPPARPWRRTAPLATARPASAAIPPGRH